MLASSGLLRVPILTHRDVLNLTCSCLTAEVTTTEAVRGRGDLRDPGPAPSLTWPAGTGMGAFLSCPRSSFAPSSWASAAS